MATKKTTVSEDAYNAMKPLKRPGESFNEIFMRIDKKKLSSFAGILSGESGERFENAVIEARKKRNEAHRARMKKIIEALSNPQSL